MRAKLNVAVVGARNAARVEPGYRTTEMRLSLEDWVCWQVILRKASVNTVLRSRAVGHEGGGRPTAGTSIQARAALTEEVDLGEIGGD